MRRFKLGAFVFIASLCAFTPTVSRADWSASSVQWVPGTSNDVFGSGGYLAVASGKSYTLSGFGGNTAAFVSVSGSFGLLYSWSGPSPSTELFVTNTFTLSVDETYPDPFLPSGTVTAANQRLDIDGTHKNYSIGYSVLAAHVNAGTNTCPAGVGVKVLYNQGDIPVSGSGTVKVDGTFTP